MVKQAHFFVLTQQTQDVYTNAFRVKTDASVIFMDKFRASKIPSAFWNNGLVEYVLLPNCFGGAGSRL